MERAIQSTEDTQRRNLMKLLRKRLKRAIMEGLDQSILTMRRSTIQAVIRNITLAMISITQMTITTKK